MSNCISLREAILNENEIICTAAVELSISFVCKKTEIWTPILQ